MATRYRQGCSHPCGGKRDSVHLHLLEAVSETADVLELIQKLLYIWVVVVVVVVVYRISLRCWCVVLVCRIGVSGGGGGGGV